MEPYIGITDFTNHEQVKRMQNVLHTHKPSASRRILHIGVMMSYKTLNDIETKWSKVFPAKETISDIFRPSGNEVYYCLHYADYNHDTRSADLARAIAYGGPSLHAIQLDMPWPEPSMVADGIHASSMKGEVILQIGKNAMEEAGDDPIRVLRRLEDYDGIIHRVLLDKSMGRGLGMDAEFLIPFVRTIQARFPALGIGVAGGLGPDTIHLVDPLIRLFPNISIDAQGRLRPSGNALDPIDWRLAESYLIQALLRLA